MTDKFSRGVLLSVVAWALSFGCSIGLAQQDTITSPEATNWQVVPLVEGLSHPWGLAWLPSGEMLITSRDGALYALKHGKLTQVPMEGLPPVFHQGQGGLMDIAVRPRPGANPWVYMTMSTGNEAKNRTTLVRGVFDKDRITGIQKLFQVDPDKSSTQHFGSRLLLLNDGSLLMSIGDGGNPPLRIGGMLARDQAQNLKTHLGSILRLDENGHALRDNPFVNRPGAKPEIWSYGHRNIQGMTRDEVTGRIWATEHGPRGGDELNLVEAGKNYGWPLASHGRDYTTNEPIGRLSIPGAVDPKVVWTPSVGASGLALYTGTQFPEWRGDLFSGGLVSHDIQRLKLDENGAVISQERLPIGERVRDVRMGPDGFLYVLTDEDNGRLLRIEPR